MYGKTMYHETMYGKTMDHENGITNSKTCQYVGVPTFLVKEEKW